MFQPWNDAWIEPLGKSVINARMQRHLVLRELMRTPRNQETGSRDVIPACFGTLVEAMEVLTLVQTGKCAPISSGAG